MASEKASDLRDRLERKIDRLTETVGNLQLTMDRVANGLEQVNKLAAAATLRMDVLESRIASLEAVRQRAEGAVWAWRLAFAGAAAVGGAIAHLLLK